MKMVRPTNSQPHNSEEASSAQKLEFKSPIEKVTKKSNVGLGLKTHEKTKYGVLKLSRSASVPGLLGLKRKHSVSPVGSPSEIKSNLTPSKSEQSVTPSGSLHEWSDTPVNSLLKPTQAPASSITTNINGKSTNSSTPNRNEIQSTTNGTHKKSNITPSKYPHSRGLHRNHDEWDNSPLLGQLKTIDAYSSSTTTNINGESNNLTPLKNVMNSSTDNLHKSSHKSNENDSSISVLDLFVDNNSDLSTSVVVDHSTSKKARTGKHRNKTEKINYKLLEPDTSTKGHKSKLDSYTRDGRLYIFMQEGGTTYFHGFCLLSVLHGSVEILGHQISCESEPIEVYSPRGSSLLIVKNITHHEDEESNKKNSKLVKIFHKENLPIDKITPNSVVILCENIATSNRVSFVEKHISQQIFPAIEENSTSNPRIVFEPKGSWNLIQLNPEWDIVLNKIDEATKLLICGGKGVGKSTFLRYAINKLLQKFPIINFIDLDPGQPEFTVPGVLSVFQVDKAVLGPNFTHLKRLNRSVLSSVSISDPRKYIAAVRHLVNNVELANSAPTLINYMGFIHGIGLNILSATVATIRPTDLLQINSESFKKNFKSKLYPHVILDNMKYFYFERLDQISYDLHQIRSMCDDNVGWTAEPRQLREMCILSYFGDIASDINSNFYYRLKLSAVRLTSSNGTTVSPAAINATLVALCSYESERSQVFRCFGWGIVRGIDLTDQTLVLLTPEKIEDLLEVTHLVSNELLLPPSLYMTADEFDGNVPYVMEGELSGIGIIPKRSNVPAFR